jgi:hypothetical protein
MLSVPLRSVMVLQHGVHLGESDHLAEDEYLTVVVVEYPGAWPPSVTRLPSLTIQER